MLVLTRKVGDVIAIGDNIKIVVMSIKGKQVRLGVQADKDTVVHREEVYQKIQQEIKAALLSNTEDTKAAGELLKSAQTDSGGSSATFTRSGTLKTEKSDKLEKDKDNSELKKK